MNLQQLVESKSPEIVGKNRRLVDGWDKHIRRLAAEKKPAASAQGELI